jgi:hypothetical protein
MSLGNFNGIHPQRHVPQPGEFVVAGSLRGCVGLVNLERQAAGKLHEENRRRLPIGEGHFAAKNVDVPVLQRRRGRRGQAKMFHHEIHRRSIVVSSGL